MPIINPSKSPNDPTIKGPCLLLINPDEMRSTAAWARKQGAFSHRLFNGELIEFKGDDTKPYYVAGPAIGAPMAVMTMEKLIALGCTAIIVYGWCGSLTMALKSGDLLLARWGASGEGTSQHYPLAHQPDSTAHLRKSLKKSLAGLGISAIHEGSVWTTDAPYRERRSEIKRYADTGIKAVDMEFTALATVAAFRGIDMAALFLVSDELYHDEWQPAFVNKAFKKKSRSLVQSLCKKITSL